MTNRHRRDCRYEDFNEDTDLNRMLKASFGRLLALPGLDLAPLGHGLGSPP
jgi:5-methylcytosine-specific restriction endonuclease McrBC regulatory subunit McrC